jgi:NTE family protein
MSRRVTAVLSGGGAKAAAHLGALEVLAQAGIIPTRFVGTSMGAVIGAGLAAGLSIAEVLGRLRTIHRDEVAALDRKSVFLGIFAVSLFKGERLRQTLERMLPVQRFSQLKLPLTVTASDLDSGELVCFGAEGVDAPLAEALYASCALPVLYPAAEIGGRRLADGGLRAVLPLEVAARTPADLVVAVDVGPGFDSAELREGRDPPALVRAHNDGQFVLMAANTRLTLELWNAKGERPPMIYVRPAVRRGETFAIEEVDTYLAAGRAAARAALQRRQLDPARGRRDD